MPDPTSLSLAYDDGTADQLAGLAPEEVAWFKARQSLRTLGAAAWPTMGSLIANRALLKRGDGLDLATRRVGPDVLVENLWVNGYRQNVWAQNNSVPGTITLRNVRALDAWRDDPSERYFGNGFWFGAGCKVVMDGCAAIGNGWQADRPPNNRNEFRHGVYAYWGSNVTITNSVFALNSACGVQFKGTGTISNCLLYANGCGVQALQGPVTVRNCLVYDGRRWAAVSDDNKGTILSWTGDTGVSAYCPADVNGLVVVGGSLQREANLAPAKDMQPYNGAALNGSKKYTGNVDPPGKAPTGAKWTVKNFASAGWAGGASGGDAPPAQPDLGQYAPPGDLGGKLSLLVEQARTTARPIPEIVAEAFAAAQVPWLA